MKSSTPKVPTQPPNPPMVFTIGEVFTSLVFFELADGLDDDICPIKVGCKSHHGKSWMNRFCSEPSVCYQNSSHSVANGSVVEYIVQPLLFLLCFSYS